MTDVTYSSAIAPRHAHLWACFTHPCHQSVHECTAEGEAVRQKLLEAVERIDAECDHIPERCHCLTRVRALLGGGTPED